MQSRWRRPDGGGSWALARGVLLHCCCGQLVARWSEVGSEVGCDVASTW